MKVNLDFDKKQIQVTGEVNLEKLIIKIMDLGLNTKEWSLVTKTEYLSFPSIGTGIDLSPQPYQPNQVWYTNS